MSDLLQEIDEAVRRDKAEKFWKENKSYIIGGAVGLVLMTGIFTAWNSYTLKKNMDQTNLLVSALSTQYPATALQAASGSLKGGHKAVAELQRAGALINDKNPDEAIAVLQTLSQTSGAPAIWRDLATIMAVRMQFEKAADKAQAESLYATLKPVLNANNPWQAPAHLQAAIIAAEGLGDYAGALKHLNVLLNDEKLPAPMQERARALDHLYGLKAAEQKSDAVTDVPESKG
jgi:hypothetical protein